MSGRAVSALGAFVARLWAQLCILVLFAMLVLTPTPALAQSAFTYTQTGNNRINDSTDCSSPVVRNFSVGDTFIVGDVDLGLLVEHSWRGDLRFVLQSPAGTRVQLTNGDTVSMNGNNFNVLLDDSAAAEVGSDSPTGNHGSNAPPYENTFRPNNPLSAFNGEGSAGTWRLEICDLFPSQDDGRFRRADLTLTALPADFADLSLAKALLGSAPADGGTATWRLSVTNASASTQTATGIEVTDTLPAGFTFVSATGTGSFDPASGVWSVGALAPGQTASIDISGTITATGGVTITNTAEITASSRTDPDSTVNNGDPAEDDYASATFIVAGPRAPGMIPVLSCPAGTALFDWNTITWTDGTISNAYPVAGIGTVGFDITTDGSWVFDTNFGGQSPTVDDVNTGGFPGNPLSLHQYLDFANQNQTATTTITLPVSVPGLQFTVLDVDFAANDFADKLTVTGTNGGATVIPTLTNGATNYVIGNTAIGDILTNGLNADGNVTVTFDEPVDTITIVYGNHTTAPAVPDGQAIAIHDITLCAPVTELGVTKISSVLSDPVNGTDDPRAIPGAVIAYCISITNPGTATATNLVVTDAIPAQLAYVPGSMTSGTSCAAATTAEDDNASGADESDPVGASVSGSTLTATTASLGPSAALAISFRAVVQ